jgi:hypothetical protein
MCKKRAAFVRLSLFCVVVTIQHVSAQSGKRLERSRKLSRTGISRNYQVIVVIRILKLMAFSGGWE